MTGSVPVTTRTLVVTGECAACRGTGSRLSVRDVSEPGKPPALEYLDFQSRKPIGEGWVRVPCAICNGTGRMISQPAA